MSRKKNSKVTRKPSPKVSASLKPEQKEAMNVLRIRYGTSYADLIRKALHAEYGI